MPRAQRGFGDIVARTLDSVVNGVSQQPPTIRLPSQCEEQLNLHSKVAVGATRRPPSELISTLHTAALPTKGYKSHIRSRDADTTHLVLIEDGDVRVWNVGTGIEAIVSGKPLEYCYSALTGTKTEYNDEIGDATASDVPALPAANVTSGIYLGSEYQFDELVVTVGTAGVGTYALTWEYSVDGNTWAALTATDGTDDFKNVGTSTITFTKPTNFGRNNPLNQNGYWIRALFASGVIDTPPLLSQVRVGFSTYLTVDSGTATADAAFGITSVADYSFIVNKDVTCAMIPEYTAYGVNGFLINFTESTVTSKWRHKLGTVDEELTVDFGVSPGGQPQECADQLEFQYYTAARFGNEWLSTDEGNIVTVAQVVPTTNLPPYFVGGQSDPYAAGTNCMREIGVPTCGWSDSTYSFVGLQTQKFSDLPSRAEDLWRTEITGTDGDSTNNYWVEFRTLENAWVETVGPHQMDDMDVMTLPYLLQQLGEGTGAGGADEFEMRNAPWAPRLKGTDITAPEPAFIGETISDIVFHKNRLGLTSGESLTLSETGQYYNFFPTTVTALIESDPITTTGTNNRIATIDFAMPFNEKLYMFSESGGLQNVLRASGNALSGLTAANAEVVEVSAYPVSNKAHPVSIGKSIFYAVDRSVSSSIYEFVADQDVVDSIEITSHIPTYLPANLIKLAACPTENLLVCLSSSDADSLYVNSWYYSGGQKVQNSWSRWDFDDSNTIQSVEFVDTDLYIVTKRTDGLHLEKLDFTSLADGGLDHRVYLDSMETLTGVYTASDNKTRWTPGCATDPASYGNYRAVLSHASWATNLGRSFDLNYETATAKLWTYGDFSDYSAHVGRLYGFTYEFTKPIIKQTDTAVGQAVPVTQGRLQIGKWKLHVRSAAGFYATVTSEEVNPDEITVAEDAYVYQYPGKHIAQGTFGVEHPRLADEFLFDVGMESKYVKIEVTGTSHLPFSLIGAEWEGSFSTRSNRI